MKTMLVNYILIHSSKYRTILHAFSMELYLWRAKLLSDSILESISVRQRVSLYNT